MCIEAMDTRSKRTKTSNCLRRTVMKSASPLKWGLLRVATKEHEALRPCRAAAVKVTIQKCLRRQQKREQLARLAKALGDIGQEETRKCANEEQSPQRRSPGAMAPENTTQYLMSKLYEDMPEHNPQAPPTSHGATSQLYGESLSPRGVYSVLDSVYESSLAFQQRDFEEVFDLCCW